MAQETHPHFPLESHSVGKTQCGGTSLIIDFFMSFAPLSSVWTTAALFPDVLGVMQYVQGNIHNSWTTSIVFQPPVTIEFG